MWVVKGKRVLRRVIRRGSQKEVSRRCLERPVGEYDPLGMCPIEVRCFLFFFMGQEVGRGIAASDCLRYPQEAVQQWLCDSYPRIGGGIYNILGHLRSNVDIAPKAPCKTTISLLDSRRL